MPECYDAYSECDTYYEFKGGEVLDHCLLQSIIGGGNRYITHPNKIMIAIGSPMDIRSHKVIVAKSIIESPIGCSESAKVS